MTTEYAWSDLRAKLIDACGDSPSAPLEQRVIDVFERRPFDVAEAIDGIIDRYQRGVVRSPWAVLAKHVEELSETRERATHVTATDSRDRDKRVSQARQWMHTAGIHFDRQDEVEDELFGERGSLRAWRNDPVLVTEMLALWRELRPLGVQVEREADERGRRHVELRKRLAAPPLPELDPVDPDELMRDLMGHAERRVALQASKGNPFLDD